MGDRAGSSPVARTKQEREAYASLSCFRKRYRTRTYLNAARMSAAREGLTERLYNFLPRGENANRVLFDRTNQKSTPLGVFFCLEVV